MKKMRGGGMAKMAKKKKMMRGGMAKRRSNAICCRFGNTWTWCFRG